MTKPVSRWETCVEMTFYKPKQNTHMFFLENLKEWANLEGI
jgi:hypothetical protein